MQKTEAEVFSELESLCTSHGFIHVLALLSCINNITTYEEELGSEDMQHLYEKERLIRTEISTVAGLLLKYEINIDHPGEDVLPQLCEDVNASLALLHRAMYSAEKDGDYDNAMIKESIFYAAESAYDFQYLDMAEEKYSLDDSWFLENMGFTCVDMVSVGRCIEFIMGRKINDFLRRGQGILNDQVLNAYELPIDQIATETGINDVKVRTIVDLFSSNELSNVNFQGMSDFNVFNARPIIRAGKKYYCFSAYSLAQAIYETPFFWMNDDKKYRPISAQHRGQFVEDYVYRKMAPIFGAENVFKNVYIVNGNNETLGEIDVLVSFSDSVIIYQAKSKKLTIEARKGNGNAIQKDFQSAIQDAYDQGFSCAQLIVSGASLADQNFNRFNLSSSVSRCYIVPIISENYPSLSFQVRQYLNTTITNEIYPPFIMDVFLLDVLTEFLNTPLYFLSYIDRRSTYNMRIFSSHELTIFSLHLKQNLWMDNECDMFMLHDDICADLDIAMLARRRGITGKRTPDGILTFHQDGFIRKIIKSLESENHKLAIELGLLLLSLDGDTIEGINQIAKKTIFFSSIDKKHHDLSTVVGDTGFTVHCNYYNKDVAEKQLHEHCIKRKYITKCKKWIGIHVSPKTYDVNYGVMLDFEWGYSAEIESIITPSRLQNTLVNIGGVMTQAKRPGRNDPCFCGSGKKYKKCCLR
ncbi:zinc chelation protein SecC [Chimaeribacter californicus]|uniref:Zinc chelation protein SecC n=1 Tax=Chimaeribacter californicus TaxID=2060067 RepID=A0A2N5E622_9GAMM|nr:SEC-C metal-binding domain-containing protein [Chimaeribacter californicus]PLR36741.1 zinc chelation protein SecC [Chimaeribacter californicus]